MSKNKWRIIKQIFSFAILKNWMPRQTAFYIRYYTSRETSTLLLVYFMIFNNISGFLSWDKDSCHVDLEKELQALVVQAPEGEEARNGNGIEL